MTTDEIIKMLQKCPLGNKCNDGLHGHCNGCNERVAKDVAIKHIKAWKKVKEDILTIQNDGNSFINISYLLENIINKHLKEVENADSD